MPEALIDRSARACCHLDNSSQPGHGLFDEYVPGSTEQASGPTPGHHLHRQNAVPAQVEEGIVDADPLQPQNLGINIGQHLFHRIRGGPISTVVAVIGCGKCPGIELAVHRQRYRIQPNHRSRHHIRRQAIGYRHP
ncbi:Uncharacterised protein [Mycobacteroides abscessus]|nr:Uncharacterised protein [Mycobacteroides abscessus]SKZ84488.1 Uncharacterised protein [Mycobacteroides abscessus subsp. abscessus]